MTKRYCLVCGNPIPKKNSKYCSNKCQGLALKGIKRPSIQAKAPWNKGLNASNDSTIAAAAIQRQKDVVGKEMLQELYTERNLTLREIGQMFNVTKSVIRRLTIEYGLIRKRELLTQTLVEDLYDSGMSYIDIAHEYNCSPAYVRNNFGESIDARHYQNDAGIEMDKETLRRLYWDEWLTYEAIAEQLGVDLTSISYWMRKFDIPRRTIWETRRGPKWEPPSIDQVTYMYVSEEMSLASIGNIFQVSKTYIREILDENNIVIRKSGYPNVPQFVTIDGHQVRSSYELQVDNWLYSHDIIHEYEPQIGDTRYKADFLIEDTYIEIWGIIGNEKYERRRKKKLQAYQRYNLKLLSIHPNHFPELQILSEYFL